MTRVLAVLAVVLALAGQPEAIETGRDLAKMCAGGESTDQIIGQLMCSGYIDGFVDAYRLSMSVMEHQAPKARKPICLPHRSVEIGQVQALIVDWLKRHPNDQDITARTVWLPLMVQVYHLEKAHPDAGRFRLWSLLAMFGPQRSASA